jgi:tryptophan-rich sensory protein
VLLPLRNHIADAVAHNLPRRWAATADSALLCAVMANYASQVRRVDRAAAALAVPEIAWTAFATVLSAAVATTNSGKAVSHRVGQTR